MKVLVLVLVLLVIPIVLIGILLSGSKCERVELGYNCKGKNCECKKPKTA